MLTLPLHSLVRRGKMLAALLTLVLVALPAVRAQEPPATAWQVLAERPEAADETFVPTLERKILQVLTPEQADAYAGGRDAAEIVLPGGETLADFIDRTERVRASGLVIRPLGPCALLDTRGLGKLAAGERRTVRVRGPKTDYSAQGGAADGCGVPGLVGEELKANAARAVLLAVEVREAEGTGQLALWPSHGPPAPRTGLVAYEPESAVTVPSLIVPVCDEESVDPCPDGDLNLRLHGAGAHVVLSVHGVLEPAGASIEAPDSETPTVPEKSTTAPYWEKRTDNDDVYYTDGSVGIGTDSPKEKLDVAGHLGVRGRLRFYDADGGMGTDDYYLQRWSEGDDINSLRLVIQDNGCERFEIWGNGCGTPGGCGANMESNHFFQANGAVYHKGHVGIGTSAPEELLQIDGGNMRLQNFGGEIELQFRTGTTAADTKIVKSGEDNALRIRRMNDSDLYTLGAGQFVVYTADMGLGTTTPQSRLDVRSSGGEDVQITMSDYTGGEETEMGYSNDKNYFAIHQNAGGEQNSFFIKYAASVDLPVFQFDTNTKPGAVVVTENGKMGVGTTAPEKTLDVRSTGTDVQIYMSDYEGGEGAQMGYSNDKNYFAIHQNAGGEQNSFFIKYAATADLPVFQLDTNTRPGAVVITENGKMGVGTTTPGEKLEVDGNIKLSGSLISDGDICIGNCN